MVCDVTEPISGLVAKSDVKDQVMNIDLFATNAGNFNGVIAGEPSIGRHVLLCNIAFSALMEGGRVWIIDAGRSFEKLCHTAGGQYFEFTPETDIRLPPFSMVVSIEEDIELLTPLFEQMISPNAPLDNFCRRQLALHIQSVWYDKGREATVDDLAYSLVNNCEMGGSNTMSADEEWLEKVRAISDEERKTHCEPRVRDLGVQLFPYTSDGPNGRYFHGEANVDFNNDLIVFELEGLATKPELKSVIMSLLMGRIFQSMSQKRDQRKVCIINEAWNLLGSCGSSGFIEKVYRRARPFYGSFITAANELRDFSLSPLMEASITNSDWMFLFSLRPESVPILENTLQLTLDDMTKEILMSLKTEREAYSEMFIRYGGMGYGIGQVLLNPFNLLLVSKKAEDFEAVRQYRERGSTSVAAIEAVLADRGVPGYAHQQPRRSA